MKVKNNTTQQRRALRVRSEVTGTTERPRLAVSRSNQHLYAQLIDDSQSKTLTGFSTKSLKVKTTKGQAKTQLAQALGEHIAQKAKDLKITQAVFDRGANRYHGRLKTLADSARKGGLKI